MKAFKERMHAIHLRDMNPDKNPIKGDGGNYVEHIVGEGPLNLEGLLKLLLEWKYQGTICLEYKPNADDPMPDLRVALNRIEAGHQRDLPKSLRLPTLGQAFPHRLQWRPGRIWCKGHRLPPWGT